VKPEDIDINCHDGVLTLAARSVVEEREYFHQEIRGVDYLRQVMLPVECRFEDARASFEHGLLEIRIPKQRPRAPEKIHIHVNRTAGPTTIDAAKGVGYSEVRQAKPTGTRAAGGRGASSAAGSAGAKSTGRESGAASKKPSGASGAARKASPGPRSEPSR
jgi:hypothetical protein